MSSFQKAINASLIIILSSHMFCCVLPMVISFTSLITGLGFLTSSPAVEAFHEVTHRFETPLLLISFVMLFLGWGINIYRQRHDVACCHHTGCSHESCVPKKQTAYKILIIATLLFLINFAIYLGENLFH